MINNLSVYREAGTRAGNARRKGDNSLVSHHYGWARRAMKLESTLPNSENPNGISDAEYAWNVFSTAYRDAWSEGRGVDTGGVTT